MMSKAVASYVKPYRSSSLIIASAVKCCYSVLGRCSFCPMVVTLEEERMANDEPFQNPIPETPSSDPFTEWKPYKLPELASNGLPFSPTFILPPGGNTLGATVSSHSYCASGHTYCANLC